MNGEKAIKGLQECDLNGGRAGNCPYKDAILALLKEREPIPVEICGKIFDTKLGDCPHCGERLNSEVYPHWCGFCGQAVKWDA